MYQNPYSAGFEVLSKSGYNVDSHGSASTTASYLMTNDFPDYAAMFYSPTEHESINSIKYGSFEQDYSNLREVQASLNGPPMEFYIPSSFPVSEGVGRQDLQVEEARKIIAKNMKNEISEIKKAQEEVSRRKIKRIEFEDVLLLRKTRRTIIFEDKEEDI
jgi:hypothetical protein|tara:strand:- start:911 stop:1390 length:480 start_codon:yes stop_codon:yes gene_type:complete